MYTEPQVSSGQQKLDSPILKSSYGMHNRHSMYVCIIIHRNQMNPLKRSIGESAECICTQTVLAQGPAESHDFGSASCLASAVGRISPHLP